MQGNCRILYKEYSQSIDLSNLNSKEKNAEAV